jgi:hypothetical protein
VDAILPYALIPDTPNVYVCGCYERWVSIYLQAVRALNLSWALIESGRIQRGARVCVVGGGFAGLTMAAGLGRAGVRVTLLERNRALLATQRDNRVRSIHPHIHEWPRPGALEPRAGLPLLDWHAGLSADMAAEVLDGFAKEVARSAIEVRTAVGAVDLTEGPRISGEPFDAVVLALGVGLEKSFGALPLRSYWADDTIARIGDGAARSHLVTGIGEGGVIDALYLCLAGFSHASIAAELAAIEAMRPIEEELLAIEREIERRSDEEANQILHARYRALQVPSDVDALLMSRARHDTHVTLNGPEAHPLAARSDVLNRFLISRLVSLGKIAWLPGKIADVTAGFEVTLDGGTHHRFDEVHIRHGTVPSMKLAFPALWDRYLPARQRLPHLTPEPMWPAGWWDGA